MADYGGYAVSREIFQSGRMTVYAASRPGDKRAYAVKVFHPLDETGRRRADAIQAFLDAAKVQQRAHAKSKRRWAPVHAAGECAEGAYLVSNYYPRSLEKVIEGRISPDLPTLYWIVSAIIRSLADLDRATGRAHGHLAPGNIFIGGPGRLRGATLVLSEPAPLAGDAGASERIADFQALGAIIAWFVRKREQDGWPIEDGPEWTSLGRYGQEWRGFCNFLLNPTPETSELTIDALRKQFAKLGGRGASTFTKGGSVVALILLVATPFVFLRIAPFDWIPERFQDFAERIGNLPPDVETVPPEFGQLCSEWYEWFGGFVSELNDPDRRARWQSDAYLRDNVLAPIEHLDQLDPRLLASDSRNFETMRASPPASAKRGTVVRHVLRAHRTLGAVAAALKNWPGRQTLADVAGRFEALEWKTAAGGLRRPAPPTLESGQMTGDIDDTLRLTARAQEVEGIWRDLAQRQQTLTETGDSVLGGLQDFYRREVAAASLDTLGAQLTDALHALDSRVKFVQGEWIQAIGHDRWLGESFVHDFRGPVTAETLTRWDSEIRDYYFVSPAEDPRVGVDWKTTLTHDDDVLRAMTTEERSLPAPAPGTQTASARFTAESNALRQQLDALAATPVLRKDIAATKNRIASLQSNFAAFTSRLVAAMDELRPNPGDWLTQIRATTVGALASLNREWTRRRDALLAGATVEKLAADEAGFRALRTRVHQLQDFLAGIDGPAGAGRLGPIDLGGVAPDLTASVVSAETLQRDAEAAKIVPLIAWNGDLPRDSLDVFLQRAEVKAAFAELATWRADAGRFAHDLQRVSGLLADGRGLDEGVHDVWTAWDANPLAAQVTATGGAAAVARDVRALASLPKETDRAALTKEANEGSLAVALTAWRRLGALADWPGTVPELDQEATLVGALRTKIFQGVTDTARRVALAGEVAAGGKQRWRKFLSRADRADNALIGEVFARLDRFGLAREELSDTERFDQLLNGLKAKAWARLSELDTKTGRDAFVQAVQALPTIASRPDVAAFLKNLTALDLEPKGISTLPADIGPGRAEWDGEFTEDGRRAVYKWRSPQGVDYAWEFVLVEPPDGVPFYLSTQAVSLGQFVELIEARPAGKDVIAALPTWVKDVSAGIDIDARLGPQTWRVAARRALGKRVNDSGITLNTRWTAFVDSRWPTPLYFDDKIAANAPTWKDPMQNIPPRAAQLFADRILGARLATSEEWAGVVKLYGELAQPGAAGANFSDQAWLAQRDYLAKQGGQFEFPWPDGGVFRPGLETEFKTRGAAEPYAPATNDGQLWFSEVDQGGRGPFHHLFGNVATYLYDPDRKQFFVAGGSALSPKEIDPRKAYPVDAYAEGFSDVGFRPAFDASPVLIIRSQLIRLIRNQLYLL